MQPEQGAAVSVLPTCISSSARVARIGRKCATGANGSVMREHGNQRIASALLSITSVTARVHAQPKSLLMFRI